MTIKSKANIQKTIFLPDRYDNQARFEIGQMIIDEIRKRTSQGVDLNGSQFKYVKDSEFKGNDLSDSGDMLDSLEVVDTPDGSVVVGYADTTSIEANQAEGNQIGSYGKEPDPTKAKPFIGVTGDELDLILAKYDSQNPQTKADSDVIESFIGNLFKSQGL